MMPNNRGECPQCLNHSNLNHSNWVLSDTCRKEVIDSLSKATDDHCSFCDSGNDVWASSLREIEHFKPKSKYPELMYDWHNLFLICRACNSAKSNKYNDLLIKPDQNNYNFYDYFIYDFEDHYILPNPSVNQNQQDQAQKTIELYKLNRNDLVKARKITFKRYQKYAEDINDLNYRFMFML